MNVSVRLSVCMSVRSRILKTTHLNFTKLSVRVTGTVARFSSDDNRICYAVHVMCSQLPIMEVYVWHRQYLPERCDGASSHKFPACSPQRRETAHRGRQRSRHAGRCHWLVDFIKLYYYKIRGPSLLCKRVRR